MLHNLMCYPSRMRLGIVIDYGVVIDWHGLLTVLCQLLIAVISWLFFTSKNYSWKIHSFEIIRIVTEFISCNMVILLFMNSLIEISIDASHCRCSPSPSWSYNTAEQTTHSYTSFNWWWISQGRTFLALRNLITTLNMNWWHSLFSLILWTLTKTTLSVIVSQNCTDRYKTYK